MLIDDTVHVWRDALGEKHILRVQSFLQDYEANRHSTELCI